MNEKNDILSFAKRYLCYTPTKFQETLLAHKGKVTLCWQNRNYFKKIITNEFTYEGLIKLKVGEKFGLVTTKGLLIFERKKAIRPKLKVYYGEAEEIK